LLAVLFLLLTKELGGVPSKLSSPERNRAGEASEGLDVAGDDWLPSALMLVGVGWLEAPTLDSLTGS
jgi:hypothetical protein